MSTTHDKQKTSSAGASIRISGVSLNVDEITRGLGRSPSHVHRKDELNQLKEPYKTDMWLLRSPIGDEHPLEAHLSWLAEVLLPRRHYISELREKNSVDIYCYLTCYTEQASLVLSSQSLRIFTELNFELGVSLIFLPDGADGVDTRVGRTNAKPNQYGTSQ